MNRITLIIAFSMLLQSISYTAEIIPYIGEMRWVTWPIIPYPGNWVRCDGRSLSIDQYQALYTIIGFTFGGDSARRTFNIPDMRGRTPIGQGQGPSLSVRQLGEKGGTERETISLDQLARHSHDILGTSNIGDMSTTTDNVLASGQTAFRDITPNFPLNESTLSTEGQGQSVENMSPFFGLYCLFGINGTLPPIGNLSK